MSTFADRAEQVVVHWENRRGVKIFRPDRKILILLIRNALGLERDSCADLASNYKIHDQTCACLFDVNAECNCPISIAAAIEAGIRSIE